jgi:hypothetical protein
VLKRRALVRSGVVAWEVRFVCVGIGGGATLYLVDFGFGADCGYEWVAEAFCGAAEFACERRGWWVAFFVCFFLVVVALTVGVD